MCGAAASDADLMQEYREAEDRQQQCASPQGDRAHARHPSEGGYWTRTTEARVWNARLAHLACLYRGSLSHARVPAPATSAPNLSNNVRVGRASGHGSGLSRDSIWKLRGAGSVGRALSLAQVIAPACACRVHAS